MYCIKCGTETRPEAKFCHACGQALEETAPLALTKADGASGIAPAGTVPPMKNEAEAVKWTRKAVDQGHAFAQHILGVMYANGEGVAQDEAEAVKYYRKAAEKAYVDAQFKLGEMYENGRGVAKDEAEAVKWYRMAAGRGHVDAQFKLGEMYENGRGVATDEAEAARWYRKVLGQGNASVQYKLGVMRENARGVVENDAEALPANPEPDSDTPPGQGLSARTVETEADMDRKFVIGIVLVFLVGLLVYAINIGIQAGFGPEESDHQPGDNPAAIEKSQDAADQGNTDARYNFEQGR
jgi:TPR repeat protein